MKTNEDVDDYSALEIAIADKRKDAVSFRQNLGIEQELALCEEAYEGVDSANRSGEGYTSARYGKPVSPEGGSRGQINAHGTRSTVFLNITRPYADAAAARVADMLIPTDDRNFEIVPVPIPEFTVPVGNAPSQQIHAEIVSKIEAERERAEASAIKAQTRIDDWLIKCQYHAELRKVIEDSARLGTGVLKGPYPKRVKKKSVTVKDGKVVVEMLDEIIPASHRIDPWNLYPDPSCGENIHNGSYIFEREFMSAAQVRGLIDQPGYIQRALEKVLKEGPTANREAARKTDYTVTLAGSHRFDVWFFSGQISRKDMEQHSSDGDVGYESTEHVDVICTLINDRIVKITRAYLDSGEFCYDLVPWQRRVGVPWGIGIVKQINVPQRMVNGAIRNMSDNAALSSAPQIVRMRGVVDPADGVDEISPRKVWWCDPNTSVDDIQKAFMAIQIPTMQQELLNIAQFALQQAENVTGMPMLMQGNQGSASGTVGGMDLLNNNANSVLRRMAKTFDDSITEPHIRRYYEWILLYGDEEEKGEFQIDARGSSSLVDRDIQRRAILNLGALVVNPAYGADPEAWFREAMRANKLEPERLAMSSKKKKAIEAQQQAQQQFLIQQQQQRVALEQHDIESQLQIEQQKIVSQAQLKAAELANQLRIAEMRHEK